MFLVCGRFLALIGPAIKTPSKRAVEFPRTDARGFQTQRQLSVCAKAVRFVSNGPLQFD